MATDPGLYEQQNLESILFVFLVNTQNQVVKERWLVLSQARGWEEYYQNALYEIMDN